MAAEPLAIEAVGLRRTHVRDGYELRSLDDVSLTVAPEEIVAVTGPSGSGKSTLLFILAGLDRPDEGTVRLAGVDWSDLEGDERARVRRRICGFISQGMALLPQATAAENVEAPLLFDALDPDVRRERVSAALDAVGLGSHGPKLPDQLSGGELQRVAIARALVMAPHVILADEPTASLDSENAQAVARLLVGAARERSAAVVLVTHDPAVARHADRIVHLRSGRVAE